jgi:hypothetical protein
LLLQLALSAAASALSNNTITITMQLVPPSIIIHRLLTHPQCHRAIAQVRL